MKNVINQNHIKDVISVYVDGDALQRFEVMRPSFNETAAHRCADGWPVVWKRGCRLRKGGFEPFSIILVGVDVLVYALDYIN